MFYNIIMSWKYFTYYVLLSSALNVCTIFYNLLTYNASFDNGETNSLSIEDDTNMIHIVTFVLVERKKIPAK